MSNMLIARFVETTLKERTTSYSPLVEAIVNSIEAILDTKRTDGKIIVTPLRNPQISLKSNESSDELQDIVGFTVEDNGVGFNKKNREAFDTLCTDNKIDLGGIGLGRFIFLKYFSKVKFKSIYRENGTYRLREFNLGAKYEIIENEKDNETDASDTKTILYLEGLKKFSYDKQLETIARKILERILVFFIDKNFKCPQIVLQENNDSVILNDLLLKNTGEIQHIHSGEFSLNDDIAQKQQNFKIEIFKIIYPRNINSKLCLTAHNRLVTDNPLHKYIPEFKEDFYEKDGDKEKNYILMAYILGDYLDNNVSFERSRFNFPLEEKDIVYSISQRAIEKAAANIIGKLYSDVVDVRRIKKVAAFQKYVDESAPWLKAYLKDIDYSDLPLELDEQTMETTLQKIKFNKELLAKTALKKIIKDTKMDLSIKTKEMVKNIHEASSSELTHYVALRKIVLDLLKKLLEVKEDGKYTKEAEIHNLIFPMNNDSNNIKFEEHNLWILDEKLNFTELVNSDKDLDEKGENRPDLIIYDKKMAYRSGNEKSNPVIVFEFKQPQRYDFVNPSAKENPIDQIIRYVNNIKLGNYKTPKGRDISVDDNTPFYGYVVCDFTPEVKDWLYNIENFIPMPDGEGYFNWFSNIRLYMEVISWDKVLKDAEQRNKIFFKKLGIV